MDSLISPHPKYKYEMFPIPTPLEAPVLSLLWVHGYLGTIICTGQKSGERGWPATSSRQPVEEDAEGRKYSWTPKGGQLSEPPATGEENIPWNGSRVNYFLMAQFSSSL